MIHQYQELIATIEAEIQFLYQPRAIIWCDKQFDGAWSKAMDRFDQYLSCAFERKDFSLAQAEGELYKNTVLPLLNKYKAHKKYDPSTSVFRFINFYERRRKLKQEYSPITEDSMWELRKDTARRLSSTSPLIAYLLESCPFVLDPSSTPEHPVISLVMGSAYKYETLKSSKVWPKIHEAIGEIIGRNFTLNFDKF